MSISAKYTITNKLLLTIKEITKVSCELNTRKIPHIAYSEILGKTKNLSAKTLSLEKEEERNYIKALEKFSKKNIDFNLNLILSVHYEVMNQLASKNHVGKFRNAETKKRVKSLVKLTNSIKSDADPLIVGGLFYKQFLTIKPFVYANKRVAILATRVLLQDLDFNAFNLLSFEKIGDVKTKDNVKWLEYFTKIVLDELNRLNKDLSKISFKPDSDLNEDQKNILKYIKKHGVITDSEYSKITERKKATRVLDFNKLIKKNLIERCGQGRQTHYILK